MTLSGLANGAFKNVDVDLVSTATATNSGSFTAICSDVDACLGLNVDALLYNSRYGPLSLTVILLFCPFSESMMWFKMRKRFRFSE